MALPARPTFTAETSVLVLTGAGISAESGVPTFRGIGGLWEGKDVTRLASPEGFDEDPKTVWRVYFERRGEDRDGPTQPPPPPPGRSAGPSSHTRPAPPPTR